MQQLGPGVSIGEAFPGVFRTLSAVEILGSASSSSWSSASSPSSQPPPVSRTPSSGSAVTDPPPPPPATRSTRPLPRATYRRSRQASPPSTATIRPASSTRRAPVPAASAVAAAPPAAAPPAAEASRPVKRKASGDEPMTTRPPNWLTCASCKKKKQLCRPPKGSKPPWSSCTTCLHDGVKCVPAPAEEPAVAGKYLFLLFFRLFHSPLQVLLALALPPSGRRGHSLRLAQPRRLLLGRNLRSLFCLRVSGFLTRLRLCLFVAPTPRLSRIFFAGALRLLLLSTGFGRRRSRMMLRKLKNGLLLRGCPRLLSAARPRGRRT